MKMPEFAQLPPTEKLPLVAIRVFVAEFETLPVTATLPMPSEVVPPVFERLPATVSVLDDSKPILENVAGAFWLAYSVAIQFEERAVEDTSTSSIKP